ncbi:MAG: DUF3817 domain-containing protein [Flavobacteriaceae bacterium]|nr:DUF3817 domain-containing protein [Flavobacteriaceae bacterium]
MYTPLFKPTAFWEGLSLLVLLFIAMPLKYLLDWPYAVKVVGMLHGVLFIAYIALAILTKKEQNWRFLDLVVVCLASVVPFGTFYVEKRYIRS